jgi:hypothetical protein
MAPGRCGHTRWGWFLPAWSVSAHIPMSPTLYYAGILIQHVARLTVLGCSWFLHGWMARFKICPCSRSDMISHIREKNIDRYGTWRGGIPQFIFPRITRKIRTFCTAEQLVIKRYYIRLSSYRWELQKINLIGSYASQPRLHLRSRSLIMKA